MLSNYLKMAVRVLLRRKFFTFISLFGISFTLVVLILAAALLDHVFAPYPPETRANRTLGVFMMTMKHKEGGHRQGPPGYAFLSRYVKDLPGAELVSSFEFQQEMAVFQGDRKIDVYLKRTDGEFWQILDFRFLEGRPFGAQDEKNANHVAVINESTRRRLFGDSTALGRSFELDDQTFRIVGVVSDVPMIRVIPFADVWVPISTSRSLVYKSEMVGGFGGLVLARSKADLPRLKSEFRSRLPNVQMLDSNFKTIDGELETSFEMFARSLFRDKGGNFLRVFLLLLMLLFMILPAVNLISLNVSRIIERASEIGVRKSFGASSRTLVGQFLTENIVLTLIGGAIGLVLSAILLAVLNRSGLIPYAQFALNWRIFLYGLGIALVFGVVSGVYPAWKMSRMHPVYALRGGAV